MHSISANFLVAVLFITATTVTTTSASANQEANLAFMEDGVSIGLAGGFKIPGFGRGWGSDGVIGSGYGAGYGSPTGGYSKGGVIRPIVVCKQRGPCFHKKVICPAKCSTSYGFSGKHHGADAGSGRCTVDCKLKCIAFC
ncbi:hypothetical protein C5167_043068 [Papaver somniferum]|uniref:Uncharacterized protein n=1 Tax=Papaver somniferum TaxID=3469 RepID=A0A4Y7L825_PAPSO|nr:hypothetical protein C5167_043068 [Papaver somniferum]